MIRHCFPLALAAALGLAATPAGAGDEIPVQAVRVALPAQVLREGGKVTLLPRTLLQAGDRVLTGARGRAALQLAAVGLMTLGANAELFVHSAELPPSGGALARLQLVRGALRIDARFRSPMPPQDFRVNAGPLRMRVYGAEIWLEVTDRGENVCLLQGAIEIQHDGDDDRIDNPGDCLLFSAEGRRLAVKAEQQETLARKLVRTAFAEDYTTRIAAEESPATPSAANASRAAAPPASAVEHGTPATTPVPASMPKAAPPATVTPAGAHRWTVVAASMPDRRTAETEAARLQGLGLAVQIEPSADGVHQRITVGHFDSPGEARRFADQVRSQYGLKDPWLLRE